MDIRETYFGPLQQWVEDPDITDLDFNGTDLWLTDTENRRIMADPVWTAQNLPPAFVEQFSQRIADIVSRQFNRRYPVLEAETEELRVTVVHESAARTGRSISIRKTLPVIRLNREKMLEEHYLDGKMLAFLLACVQAHQNIVFCGMPGTGKTECLKFFASGIPAWERVITIEDTMEIHYSRTGSGKDCVELKVDASFSYPEAIKTSLRMNPRWIMLSEVRSREAKYLLESWSTGIRGMTTLHTDDVRNAPDRILTMMENRQDADRMENDIYEALDVGVLLRRAEDGQGNIRRFIDQICCYYREDGQNRIRMLVMDGVWVTDELPPCVCRRFAREGIEDYRFSQDADIAAEGTENCRKGKRG